MKQIGTRRFSEAEKARTRLPPVVSSLTSLSASTMSKGSILPRNYSSKYKQTRANIEDKENIGLTLNTEEVEETEQLYLQFKREELKQKMMTDDSKTITSPRSRLFPPTSTRRLEQEYDRARVRGVSKLALKPPDKPLLTSNVRKTTFRISNRVRGAVLPDNELHIYEKPQKNVSKRLKAMSIMLTRPENHIYSCNAANRQDTEYSDEDIYDDYSQASHSPIKPSITLFDTERSAISTRRFWMPRTSRDCV